MRKIYTIICAVLICQVSFGQINPEHILTSKNTKEYVSNVKIPKSVAPFWSEDFASGVPTDDNNLVSRALQLCGKTAHVHIEKNIPHGGGLGGGSADAAAIFRWANYQDLEAASRIGADIPFCMVGGRARVRGIGEIIEPLPFVARTITLILLPFGVSQHPWANQPTTS